MGVLLSGGVALEVYLSFLAWVCMYIVWCVRCSIINTIVPFGRMVYTVASSLTNLARESPSF